MKTFFMVVCLGILGIVGFAETSHEVNLSIKQGMQAETEKDLGPVTWSFRGRGELLYKLGIEQFFDASIHPTLEWDFVKNPNFDADFDLDFYEAYFRLRDLGLSLGVADRPHLRFASFMIKPNETSLELLDLSKKIHGELSFAYEFIESQINVYEKDIIEYLGLRIEGLELGIASSQGTNSTLMASASLSLGDFGLLYTEQNFIKQSLTPQLGRPRADAKDFEYKGLAGLQITLSDLSQAIYLEYCYNSTGYDSALWLKTSPHIFGLRIQNQNTTLVSYAATALFDTLSHGIVMANVDFKIIAQLSLGLDASIELKTNTLAIGLWLKGAFKAEETL